MGQGRKKRVKVAKENKGKKKGFRGAGRKMGMTKRSQKTASIPL